MEFHTVAQEIVPWCWTLSTTFSDYLVVIGNDWTRGTYQKYTDTPIRSINATALFNSNVLKIQRDIELSKKHFLWFGSSGLVHKGLDLCVEYFAQTPDYVLHICGPWEDDFFLAMESFHVQSNIIYHGFVDVSTNEFIDIVTGCLFAILPSCSEGQSTSLLTAMSTGLIPIGTKETGIDLDGIGFLLEKSNIDSITQCVNQLAELGIDELARLSESSRDYVLKNHGIESFRKNMKSCLDEAIELS